LGVDLPTAAFNGGTSSIRMAVCWWRIICLPRRR
jgi:hypothetical protein